MADLKNNTILTDEQFKSLATKVSSIPNNTIQLIAVYKRENTIQNSKTRYAFLKKVFKRRATKKESDEFLMTMIGMNIIEDSKVGL